MFNHQVVTAKQVAKGIVKRMRDFRIARRLNRIERDQEYCRKQQRDWRRAELYLQREAMFLRVGIENGT